MRWSGGVVPSQTQRPSADLVSCERNYGTTELGGALLLEKLYAPVVDYVGDAGLKSHVGWEVNMGWEVGRVDSEPAVFRRRMVARQELLVFDDDRAQQLDASAYSC